MSVWLERFALAVLATLFGSTIIANPWKLDRFQQATIVVALIALSLFAARTVERMREGAKGTIEKSTAEPSTPGSVPELPKGDGSVSVPLPDDAAQIEIMKSLAAGNLAVALRHMEGLSDRSAMESECEHIFAYCLKNPSANNALDTAAKLANKCWDGEARKEKLQAVALEAVKHGVKL